MTTNKVHDPENKNCLFNFYSHAHVGVSECKMCPCTCEKQQPAPQCQQCGTHHKKEEPCVTGSWSSAPQEKQQQAQEEKQCNFVAHSPTSVTGHTCTEKCRRLGPSDISVCCPCGCGMPVDGEHYACFHGQPCHEHASVTGEEWKRCVDILDRDHSKCSLPQTCIGYQNAQSDLMNNPPLASLLPTEKQ